VAAVTFEISTWTYGRKAGRNGHVVWAKNFYSVLFTHIGAHVDLRVTDTMMEIYRGDERLTSHLLLLDRSTESMRTMLLELMERRYGETSTVFCTQYSQKDWPQRLGSGVHADAIMDRIIHNTIWVETGNYNMREHTAPAAA
jgi:hypothetical protein